MSNFLIGWAEESIVPDGKVELDGQFYDRVTDEVESDISATSLAISSDGNQAIIISVDIVQITSDLLARTREKFSAINSDVDPKNLIIAATHIHTGPKYEGVSTISTDAFTKRLRPGMTYTELVEKNDDVMSSDEVMEFLAQKIAVSANRAWENRACATYSNEFGRAAVGMCRRVKYDDGSAQMWGDTNTANFMELEGGNDSGVELLYFFDKDDRLTGVVANICCPAQILEHRSFISSDYWGKAKEFLRKKFGPDVYLLGLCGAAGDQCPRDLVRWVEPETPINDPNIKRPNVINRKADPSMFDISGCTKAGKRVANEIISVYEEIEEKKDSAEFVHNVIDLKLPLRKATISDYNNALREVELYFDRSGGNLTYEDRAKLHIYTGTLDRYDMQQNTEMMSVETHIIKFGDVAIATNPFELFLDYGNRIRARSKAKQTMIVQLCGGSLGYLPTEKAEKGGHYSAYISSGFVGHEGGDLLVRSAITTINEMFGKEEKDV